MRDKTALHDGSNVEADPLRDTRFEAMLAVLSKHVSFRWTWAEEEVQRLIAAGWVAIGEGELRYTFNSAEGDECSVNVFAEAYEQLTDEFEPAVRLVPGRSRSATWMQTDLLMMLTSHQFKLVKPVSGPRSEVVDGDERNEDGPDEVCECHIRARTAYDRHT